MPDPRAYSSDAFNSLPFREQLDALYGISARDRRDLILSAPNAQRLVRAFAAESLYHTLKEIGLEEGASRSARSSISTAGRRTVSRRRCSWIGSRWSSKPESGRSASC
jgi:hypothetical protein